MDNREQSGSSSTGDHSAGDHISGEQPSDGYPSAESRTSESRSLESQETIHQHFQQRLKENAEHQTRPVSSPHCMAACWLIIAALCTLVAMIPPFSWAHNTCATLSCFMTLWLFTVIRKYSAPRMVFLLMIGLLFSILGDWLMNIRGPNEKLFIFAIASFFTAHLSFLVGFSINGKWNRWSACVALVLLAVYLPYYFLRISPEVNSLPLKAAVLGYLLVSVFSLTATTVVRFNRIVRAVAILGICMIVFSDTLIAELVFVGNNKWEGLIIPTYVLTHLLLTIAIVLDHFFNELSSNCYLSSNHG